MLRLLFLLSVVQASHFRGGYLSWKTDSQNATNGTLITIDIQKTFSWTYARYNCLSTVGDADYLNCISPYCSTYPNNVVSIQGACIGYDIGLSISTGQSVTSVTLPIGSKVILMYTSNAWLPLVYSTTLVYSLIMSIDLTVRSDNGRINSSPTSTMMALVTVLVNAQQALRIPMADIDSDIVKCRWANQTSLIYNATVDECQGICQNIVGAQLFTSSTTDNNCTLIFTAVATGYYVIALQIEDFMPSAPNGDALSTIPLQFVVQTLNISCDQPSIIGPLAAGSTVQADANSTISVTIIAQAGCNTSSINRFYTIITPLGVSNTTAVQSLGSSLYSITFLWTPTDDQIGTTQLFCTVAIDTNNLQSAQYCLNFLAITATTTTANTISSTTATAASTNNLASNLGLILGIGIPLLLLLSILASCAICRWNPADLWKKFRQRFLGKESTSSKQYQRSYSQESSANQQQAANVASRQYREQYINEPPITPTSQSSYIDSYFTDPRSSVGAQSTSTTRTTLLSNYSSHSLPDVETSTSVTNPFQSMHPIDHRGSILVQAYIQQGQNGFRV